MRNLLICWSICLLPGILSAQQGRIRFKATSPKAMVLDIPETDQPYYLKKDRKQPDSQQVWVLFGGEGGELHFSPRARHGSFRLGQQRLHFRASADSVWQLVLPGDSLVATLSRSRDQLVFRLSRPLEEVAGLALEQPTAIPLGALMSADLRRKKWKFIREPNHHPDPLILMSLLFMVAQ